MSSDEVSQAEKAPPKVVEKPKLSTASVGAFGAGKLNLGVPGGMPGMP